MGELTNFDNNIQAFYKNIQAAMGVCTSELIDNDTVKEPD
jgi:hypothetical protein